MDIRVVVPKVNLYPYTGCIRFPLIKPDQMTADFLAQTHQAGVQPPLSVDMAHALAARMITDHLEPQFSSKPIANAIKSNPNIPVFSAAGGGTLYNLPEGRKAEIAIYKCNCCRALYVLPQDVKDAAQKLDMAIGADGMTEDEVRQTCISAMHNAFEGPNIGKSGNAEIYCFEEFVVMVC